MLAIKCRYKRVNSQTIFENSFNNGESAEVRVLNMVGQTVLSNKIADFSGSNQLDISSLRDGIYMLEITSNKKTSAQRIVLSR